MIMALFLLVPSVVQPLKVRGQAVQLEELNSRLEFLELNLINSRLVQELGSVGENKNGARGDLPLGYSLQDVALSDTMADKLHTVVKEQADKVLSRKHEQAKQGCANSDGNVLDSGGWCLTPGSNETTNTIVYNDINIVIPTFHIVAPKRMVTEIAKFIEDESIASVNDFGGGVGQYKAEVSKLVPKIEWNSYDGAGNIYEYTKGFVNYFDLTLPLELPKADWVVNLEVGEHVPNEFEGMLIRNLHHHNCKGVILSWGVLGQAGHSHINNHSNDYVISIFTKLGYVEDLDMKARLRNGDDNYGWFVGSSMVFRRSVPSTSQGCSGR
jgi:hypothetical protein